MKPIFISGIVVLVLLGAVSASLDQDIARAVGEEVAQRGAYNLKHAVIDVFNWIFGTTVDSYRELDSLHRNLMKVIAIFSFFLIVVSVNSLCFGVGIIQTFYSKISAINPHLNTVNIFFLICTVILLIFIFFG